MTERCRYGTCLRKKKALSFILVSFLLSASIPGTANAFLEFEKGPFVLDMGASLRAIFAGFQNYRDPMIFGERNTADGMSQGILRMTAEGGVGNWYKYEVHAVQSVISTTSRYSFLGSISTSGSGMYRFLDVHLDWADSDDLIATLDLDRFNIKISLPWFDVTLGRQAINFSKAYFFSPLDVFLAFGPTTFDREYKPGVDALKVDVPLGDFSGLTMVASLGKSLSISTDPFTGTPRVQTSTFRRNILYCSALLARAYTSIAGLDVSLQGGAVYGGYQVGAGFQGDLLGVIGIRGELAYLFASSERRLQTMPFAPAFYLVEDSLSAVIGLDRRFDNSLYIAAEYFYNGAGGGPKDFQVSMARVMAGTLLALSEHELGVLLSYEPYPLLKLQLSWLFSATDQSSLLSPSLVYSISDEAEFLFSAFVALGKRPVNGVPKSEYGTYPNVYFGEFKFYF